MSRSCCPVYLQWFYSFRFYLYACNLFWVDFCISSEIGTKFILLFLSIQPFQHCFLKMFLSLFVSSWHVCEEYVNCVYMSLFLGSLFWTSICVCLVLAPCCLCYSSFELYLKISSVMRPVLFVLLRVSLVIWEPFVVP